MPQKTKTKCHKKQKQIATKKQKLFGSFIYFIYLCTQNSMIIKYGVLWDI